MNKQMRLRVFNFHAKGYSERAEPLQRKTPINR
jgi:hypothetical protein